MSFKDRFKTTQQRKLDHEIQSFICPNYQFHENYGVQLECKAIDSATGGRHYAIDSNSRLLPSVTTILSATQSESKKKALENWKERVGGEANAERLKNAGADRGSILHNLAEDFLLGRMTEEGFKNPYFKQIYPYLLRINNIRQLENVLYSTKLGIAGRVDCIAEFDGILSVIDFKTATAFRESYYITDYFHQETMYALMYGEHFGEKIKQIVTLMAIDGHVGNGQIFIEKPINFVEPVVARIKQYHMIKSLRG